MITRWLLSCLLLTQLTQPIHAKKDEPTITSTKFAHEPMNLFYFEDSDTVLFQDAENGNIHRSTDAGAEWKRVDEPDMRGNVIVLIQHPYDRKKAYALGAHGKHWITTDQAESWTPFEVDAVPSVMGEPPLAFHGRDSSKVIFHGDQCEGIILCEDKMFYTTDDFRSVKSLRDDTISCSWAVGHPQFAEDLTIKDDIDDRIMCVVPGLKTTFGHANRLVYSDDFFKANPEGVEMKLQQGRPISGVISTASVKKFIVAAARSQGTDELALYVTDNSNEWHRAEFGGHRLEKDAYTVLESTNYSLQVDVLTTGQAGAMGVLFTSNSNGTYFTPNIEHTNRNPNGLVDFEKIADIQGIVLVNTVKNWEKIEEDPMETKKVVSKISFDDGRTFQSPKVGDKDLHLHSVTDLSNSGRVFSSPAPGLVMGIGNTGDSLKGYSHGDLYVSDDAGVTWQRALEGPYKYEFGDQGAVMMAVNDDGSAHKIKFSLDHGKEWESADLEHKIYPRMLTTTPDSTSLKFLLVGSKDKDGGDFYVYSIDFDGLHERKCKDDDFEKWPARLDENGDPDCLMGHKQFFKRRKANADCFVHQEFKDPEPTFEPCKCSAEDFECDYNFVRSEDRKDCLPAVPLTPPSGECKKPSDKYTGPSGWRLIPGDNCIRKGGENLDKETERSCSDSNGTTPTNGPISAKKQTLDSSNVRQFYYLERKTSESGDDESIIMQSDDQALYISRDHGKTWKEPLKGAKVVDLIPHPYFSSAAFFLTDSNEGYWTVDRGKTLKSFKVPIKRNREGLPPLAFHEQYSDWLIWTGAADCGGSDCHSEAHISKNRGENWELLLRYVKKCEFASREDRKDSEDLIFCEQYENENAENPVQLKSSDNRFADSSVHFKDVVDFATMAEFIVVASRDKESKNSLKASASIDGKIFADAEFPVNLDVPVQKAYTVLDSSTHAVFLHVSVSTAPGAEYGPLIKSNSNGTSYVLSINAVNRNEQGYVDFEKMQGLEGVAIVNIVGNVDAVDNSNNKKLKTMITHNDGAQWTLLPPPEKDADGKGFGCSVQKGKGTQACSLHLHGYTERRDPRDTFASGSAIGLMMGVGNVGEHLTSKEDADTFITQDGGVTWKSVKKGRYVWEYGDAGSVIVIVPENKATKTLYYSVDEGNTWKDFQFTDSEMKIADISTLPSDTSKNFLLWGRDASGKSDKLATVNLDFSGLRERSCKLDEDLDEKDDYYIWEPKHPLQEDNCLFGHVEQYHRKKASAKCWNDWQEPHVHSIGKNCTCTRQDFEWYTLPPLLVVARLT